MEYTQLARALEQARRLNAQPLGEPFSQTQGNGAPPFPHIPRSFDLIIKDSRDLVSETDLNRDAFLSRSNAQRYLVEAGVDTTRLGDDYEMDTEDLFKVSPYSPHADVRSRLDDVRANGISRAMVNNQTKVKATSQAVVAKRERRAWANMRSRLLDVFSNSSDDPLSAPFYGSASPTDAGLDQSRSFRDTFAATTTLNSSLSHPHPSSPAASTSAPGLLGNPRALRFLKVVEELNNARNDGRPFPIIKTFRENVADIKGSQSEDALITWDILSAVIGEDRGLEEGAFTDRASSQASRSAFVTGARSYLEAEFRDHIDRTIKSRLIDAQQGGVPSDVRRVEAYIRTLPRIPHSLGGTVAGGDARPSIWAVAYHLLRAGHLASLQAYAREMEGEFTQEDPAFLTALSSYIQLDHHLPHPLRTAIQAYFTNHLRNARDRVDVYRYLLYKIIGRCELRKRSFQEVISVADDYIWLQLVLITDVGPSASISSLPSPSPTANGTLFATSRADQQGDLSLSLLRSVAGGPSPAAPSTSPFRSSLSSSTAAGSSEDDYPLQALQDTMVKWGPEHFSNPARPLLYVQVLLLTGQFAKAIHHLQSSHGIDALHMLIATAYYGILASELSPAIPISPGYGPSLSFGASKFTSAGPSPDMAGAAAYEASEGYVHVLVGYARQYYGSSAPEAIQYLYLLLLGKVDKILGVRGAPISATPAAFKPLLDQCHQHVRSLLAHTHQYEELLGRMDARGRIEDGRLIFHLRLLGLRSRAELHTAITAPLADRCAERDEVMDAVRLYSIIAAYPKAVTLVISAVGDALMQQRFPHPTSTPTAPADSTALGHAEEVISMSKALAEVYGANGEIRHKIDPAQWRTLQTLLGLDKYLSLGEAGHYDAALKSLKDLNLLPLGADATQMQSIIASTNSFTNLDPSITRNIPGLFVKTMEYLLSLYRQVSSSHYAGPSRLQIIKDIRREARSLVAFSGMIRLQMPADTYARLNRLEAMMC